MGELFNLNGASPHDPAVEAWFGADDSGMRALARHWWDVIRACGPDVREIFHDRQPTACVGVAAFAYVNAFRAHVNVGFYQGAALPDPAGLLEGTGKRMRHVKVRPDAAVDEAALGALIAAAYEDMRGRALYNRHTLR